MLPQIRRTCLCSASLWTGLLTAAMALAPGVRAQSAGSVSTLGGTGVAGNVNGVKGFSQFNTPTALALRGDGQLYIADYNNNAVRALRLSDNRVTTFSSANRPVGLAFDSNTNVFVANQGDVTITKYDYFGNFRQTLHPTLTGGAMTALAIDRNNNLYIAQERGVITRLNTNGVADATFQAPPGVHDFRGVAVANDGTIFASDAASHVIWRFTAAGEAEHFAGTLNSPGSTQGEKNFGRLNRPHQIAIGPNGSLVVADRGNHQVRVVSCAGVVSVLYGIDPARWFYYDSPDVFPGWWDSTAEFAELREPVGLAVDVSGKVFDSEVYYHLIRGATGVQFPLACSTGGAGGGGDPTTPDAVPVPVLDPNSGFYPNGVTVTISASEQNAAFSRGTRIFYTLDGSDPGLDDTEVPIAGDGRAYLALPGPVDLAALRVRAFVGTTGSDVATAQPTEVPTPRISPAAGYYPMGVDVVVTSTNGFPAGTLLYYTTDGTVPTTNSLPVLHDGTQGIIAWRDARRDLRSLRVKAFLGPNEGDVVAGQAVNFPGEPDIQGEVGIPPARSGFNAGIGSFYILPIVANLRSQQQLRSLIFVVELTALPGSPRLERTDLQVLAMSTNDFIQVLPASSLPPDSTIATARDGVNRLALAYFGTNSGFNVSAGFATVALLGIQFRAHDSLGNTAEVGDGYTIRVTQVTGTSDGVQQLVPLKPMSDRTIRFQNIKFREGDTSPAYWYNAGDFGNNFLESGDVNNAIFAAFGFRRPPPRSDAFAAMDVYRVGVLENVIEYNDPATILRRALGFESPDFFRVRDSSGEWESSTSALRAFAAKSAGLKAFSTSGSSTGPIWSRDAVIHGGFLDRVEPSTAISVPVYMTVDAGLAVSGMQFVADVIPVNGAPPVSGVQFSPSSVLVAPTTYGSSVPGLGTLPSTVYARWDNVETGLKGTVVLGYIQFVTPSTVQSGQHYDIVLHETGGASINWETGALTAYLFESIHGEVWPWISHAQTAQVSDDWKVHFFGSTVAPEADPENDADADGFTNAQEYRGGTDPNTADWHVKSENGHFVFRWFGQLGRAYSVEKTQDFKTWSGASVRMTGQDAFLEYSESNPSPGAQFYRLNVQ